MVKVALIFQAKIFLVLVRETEASLLDQTLCF